MISLKASDEHAFVASEKWALLDRKRSMQFDAPDVYTEITDNAYKSTTTITWTPQFETLLPGESQDWEVSASLGR